MSGIAVAVEMQELHLISDLAYLHLHIFQMFSTVQVLRTTFQIDIGHFTVSAYSVSLEYTQCRAGKCAIRRQFATINVK